GANRDVVLPCQSPECIEPTQDCPQIIGQVPPAGFLQRVGDAIKAFRYAASNGSQSIAVTAQRNGRADNVLKTLSFPKCSDGLGDCFHAGLNVMINQSYLVTGTIQRVAELFLDVIANLCFAVPGPCQENGTGGRLCALDPLRMIMSDHGRQASCTTHLIQHIK